VADNQKLAEETFLSTLHSSKRAEKIAAIARAFEQVALDGKIEAYKHLLPNIGGLQGAMHYRQHSEELAELCTSLAQLKGGKDAK